MTKQRDFQRTQFYAWETSRFRSDTITKLGTLTSEECTAMVEDICHCYGVDVPTMVFPPSTSNTSKYKIRFGQPSIHLYDWARNRACVIHETAHHINYRLGGGLGHGVEYVAIYAYLISEYMSIPLYEIRHKAMQAGLQLAPYCPTFKEVPNRKFVKRYC